MNREEPARFQEDALSQVATSPNALGIACEDLGGTCNIFVVLDKNLDEQECNVKSTSLSLVCTCRRELDLFMASWAPKEIESADPAKCLLVMPTHTNPRTINNWMHCTLRSDHLEGYVYGSNM